MYPGSLTATLPSPKFLAQLKEKFPRGTKKTLFTKVIKGVDDVFSTVAGSSIKILRTVAKPVATIVAGAWSAWSWVAAAAGSATTWLLGTIVPPTIAKIAGWLTESWVKWFPVSALIGWVGGRVIWAQATKARIGVAASVDLLPEAAKRAIAEKLLSTRAGQVGQAVASLGTYIFQGFASTRGF